MIYEYKTKPYEHQKEGLAKARGRTAFAFFMEMGTGKTKLAIDEAGILWTEGKIDTMLIFAPKGVYRNWIRELGVHMSVPFTVQYWESGGGNKDKQRRLEALLTPDPSCLRILVINIEAIQTKGIATKYVDKFVSSGRCYINIDESTSIKSPTSGRTKEAIAIGRKCAYRRISSGSPSPNSPLDLYSQFDFLESGLIGTRSYFNFRARYAVMQQKVFGGRKVQVVVGYRNVGDLNKYVSEHSFRKLKEECMDLPPKTYRSLDVELTDEQQRLYAQMRDEAFAEFEGGFTSSQNAITTMMRLQQILCGHIKDADGNLHRVNSNRIETIMDDLEGVSGACIIWSRFRPEVEDIVAKLRENYGEASVAQYHGGNTNTRESEAQRYMDDDKCRFMVSTQQSGGYGNTWLKGVNTYYASNSFHLDHRLQSEDRPHRGGQTEKCTYTDLIARGTLDEKLIKALRAKINIAETIMGDSPRDWI